MQEAGGTAMRILIAALLALMALAGCLDDEPTPDPDTDSDGFSDAEEADAGTDPEDANSNPGASEPETMVDIQTKYSWGPGLGCTGDLVGSTCLSFNQGPGNDLDGVWIELTDDHAGVAFTTTVANVLGDSDCEFTDASGAVISDANQGQAPCSGTVPAGAAWMHLYSYVEPHAGMTLTFTP